MSSERLLSKETEDDEIAVRVNTASASISREWHRYFCRTAMLHLAILLVYTIAFTLTLNHLSNKFRNGPDLIHSPAQEAVRYKRTYINNDVNATNSYKGTPRPELDDAWSSLFEYNNIRVTKAELDRMNRTSIQLADGSGDYLAALDVYHHLHCLKMIRHYIYPEYYDMPKSLMVDTAEHIDHCLDAIRNELICRAEVTFTTYEWLPDLPIPWAQLSYDHTCVDFDAIHKWSGSRAIDIFDPKYLIHPTKGPSYPPSDKDSHTKLASTMARKTMKRSDKSLVNNM